MRRATLGALEGAGSMISRESPPNPRSYRGSFAFQSKDEAAALELQTNRGRVLYDGTVDGEPGSVVVSVVAVSVEAGIAYIEG
jgi:hypothetical protein